MKDDNEVMKGQTDLFLNSLQVSGEIPLIRSSIPDIEEDISYGNMKDYDMMDRRNKK